MVVFCLRMTRPYIALPVAPVAGGGYMAVPPPAGNGAGGAVGSGVVLVLPGIFSAHRVSLAPLVLRCRVHLSHLAYLPAAALVLLHDG